MCVLFKALFISCFSEEKNSREGKNTCEKGRVYLEYLLLMFSDGAVISCASLEMTPINQSVKMRSLKMICVDFSFENPGSDESIIE